MGTCLSLLSESEIEYKFLDYDRRLQKLQDEHAQMKIVIEHRYQVQEVLANLNLKSKQDDFDFIME